MGKVMISGVAPQMKAPISDIPLSSLAEGSVVKLNENGSPVEFYVAKHDYESTLNGTGRTLLVRKDCYDTRVWHTDDINAYASSDINSWLNNTYKNLFSEDIRDLIGTTKFKYTVGGGNKQVRTLERSVFLLSVTELGKSTSSANTEGSALEVASIIRKAYFNGISVYYWTRTPRTDDAEAVYCIWSNGESVSGYLCSDNTNNLQSRPCFTLPNNVVFDKDTLILKGVS